MQISIKEHTGHGLAVEGGGPYIPGQSSSVDVIGADLNDGDNIGWSSSSGGSFSPTMSAVVNGSASTTYTAPSSGSSDTITATNITQSTVASATVTITSGGGGGGGGGNSALTNAAVISAATAMNNVSDYTAQAACAPVKAFQAAWNAAGGTPTLSVDGGYGPNTAAANAQVAAANGGGGGAVVAGLTSGFPNCGGGGSPPGTVTCPDGSVHPAGYVCAPLAPPSTGMAKWVKYLLWGIVAVGVASGLYWAFGTAHGRKTLHRKSGAAEKRRKRTSTKKRKR